MGGGGVEWVTGHGSRKRRYKLTKTLDVQYRVIAATASHSLVVKSREESRVGESARVPASRRRMLRLEMAMEMAMAKRWWEVEGGR